MVAIICTVIICVTVLLCVTIIARVTKDVMLPAQQEGITQEDLDNAYKNSNAAANFQDVVNFINKEFMGIDTEDENEDE